MKILKYEEPPNSEGVYITLKEAYECCCIEYKDGYKPEMYGTSFAKFLEKLADAEKECFLNNADDSVYIDYDNIRYSY